MSEGTWREERLLIGGKLVDASDGGTFENVNPATEEVLGVVADGTAADMDAAIAAARTRLRRDRLVDRRRLPGALPAPAPRVAAAPRRRAPGDDRRRGRLPGLADVDGPVRRADRGRRVGGRPGRELRVGDRPRQRRAVRHPDPPLRAARAGRRRRRDHAVELPDPDQPGEDGARARGRQHRRAEAGARHAVVGHAARQARSPRRPTSRRRRQHRRVLGPPGRRAARRGPAGRRRLVHRLDRDGPQGDAGGLGQPQEGVPRARRQVGDDRARRRRHRRRGRRPAASR